MHEIDALTGLPNRQGLATRLDHALAVARREGGAAAVLFLDLDGFKAINDGRGHAAGDAVLREIAARLRSRLRDTDTVARLGGDEFVVVAERVDDAQRISTLARKLLAVVTAPVLVGQESLTVSASIGIALGPGDADTAEALLAAADAAMYAAKRDGKNAFRYYSRQMHEAAEARLAAEQALGHRLVDGGLECLYEPEWDVMLGRPSAWALHVEWTPEGELRSGDAALRVADRSQLSAPLARWLITAACADAARLRRFTQAVPVALRLTRRQLGDQGVVRELERALERHALPAGAVRVEVAQGASGPLTRDVAATLDALRALGVPVAIADFGVGASDIDGLVRAPVNAVTLAPTLVAALEHDRAARQLVAATVALSRPLGVQVIADGVDEVAAADRLLTLGCGVMRGACWTAALTTSALRDAGPRLVAPPLRGDDRTARVWTGRGWRTGSVSSRVADRPAATVAPCARVSAA